MITDDSRRVSWLLGLLFGLAGMGSSSAAIALPLMGDDLGVGVGVATWTISLYALMLAVTTAVYGRISDLVGVRIPLMVGIGLMTGGALVAAFAPTFETLLLGPALPGRRRRRGPDAGRRHAQCEVRRSGPRPRLRPAGRRGRGRQLPGTVRRRARRARLRAGAR